MLDDPLDRDYPRSAPAEPGGGPGGPGGNGGNGGNGGGRPVRKDEIELEERGLYIESWMPERRSRRRPLLFVHGELAGSWLWERWLRSFAGRGWEGHALNLRNHHWSKTADPATLSFETYLDDVVAGIERLGPDPVVIGHGMGGLLALKAAAERAGVAGLVLVDAELPAELRPPVKPHVVRDLPVAYGRAAIGWDTPPEKLQRENRDLTLDDVLRVKHLLGQKPRESGRVRGDMLAGVPVARALLGDVPRLVVGSGLDGSAAAVAAERLASWLGAEHEQYGAHSHYGLVLGTESHRQVADRVRAFLETHHL
jgi:pimeloyl-ACP methyl ester carboxylesterase